VERGERRPPRRAAPVALKKSTGATLALPAGERFTLLGAS
jgi:hypothetical protein